ncbi:MAG: hypothetical protein QOF62_3443 [Pyrinomonadaceae bacterium]|nr:hypothetical protein [Pyrinomonadaceae bacterium]
MSDVSLAGRYVAVERIEQMSDKLQFVAALRQAKGSSEQVHEKVCPEPAVRGDSVKPGVKRSATPGLFRGKSKSPRSGRQPFTKGKLPGFALSHAPRAWDFNDRRPGVPLRSTPGFMLPPATRVLETLAALT